MRFISQVCGSERRVAIRSNTKATSLLAVRSTAHWLFSASFSRNLLG